MAGQTDRFTRRLEAEMRAASDELDFERAARLRDDIGALRRAMERNTVVLGDGTDADVIALADDPLEAAVQVFHVRGGRVRGQRGFVVERIEELSAGDLVEQLLLQLYGGETGDAVPREVLVPTLPQSPETVASWLADRRGSQVDLRVPQRGDKRALMETVARNAEQSLALHKTRRGGDLTIRSLALNELQAALGLAQAPLRIECFDVSNLQGSDIVASMVVFEDGLPRKSEYRRFAIRTVGDNGSDDVRSIHEVVTRRFRRYLEERSDSPDPELAEGEDIGRPRRFAYPPNLVVVDGGAPQVEAARRALDELGIDDVALCGLAKRLEEVWLPADPDPVILPRTSEGLYLLQRVRDEAHRFAISYHRQKRSRGMVDSALDAVPGLGETRRAALLKRFGSLKRLKAASVDELVEVPGIGRRTAESIVAALAAAPAGQPAVNVSTGEILD
jgi:excinuclease ABC subunit C